MCVGARPLQRDRPALRPEAGRDDASGRIGPAFGNSLPDRVRQHQYTPPRSNRQAKTVTNGKNGQRPPANISDRRDLESSNGRGTQRPRGEASSAPASSAPPHTVVLPGRLQPQKLIQARCELLPYLVYLHRNAVGPNAESNPAEK